MSQFPSDAAHRIALPPLQFEAARVDPKDLLRTRTVVAPEGLCPHDFDAWAATKLSNWLNCDRFLSNPIPGIKKTDLVLAKDT